jgi:hypothetical protein
MPRITTSAISSRAAIKGEGAIHTEKWHRCWVKVQEQGHDSSAAAAICTASLGYDESVNPEHQARKPAKKTDAAKVLKYNPHHDETGRFTSGGGGGGGHVLTDRPQDSSSGDFDGTLDAAEHRASHPEQYEGHVPITQRLYEAGALKLSAKEKKYHGIADATVVQVPARAKAQAQAKAMMQGYLSTPPVRAAAVAEARSKILSNFDRADAAGTPRPQFEIFEVPPGATAGDKATREGIRNYAKALRAQLAPKPIQAAQHAKSHVHGKSKT